MAYYLISDGSYSSYGVCGIVEGPDDLDIPNLARAFEPIFDHGERALWADHNARCPKNDRGWTVKLGQSGCPHETEWEEIHRWRCEYFGKGRASFVEWLIKEHGCADLPYTEFNLEYTHDEYAAEFYEEQRRVVGRGDLQ